MSHNISPVSNRLSNTSLVGHFFNRLESNLSNIGEASKELLHLLCLNIPDYSQMFEYLFILLPDMSDGDFAELKDNLPHFLARCPEMLKEQRDLALLLCKRQLRVKPLVTGFSSYNLAMDYCAKAIQLSEKLNDPQLIREAHLTATSLILESYLKSGLFKQRIEIIRGGGNLNFFICRIIEIHQLTVFCTQDSDRNLIDIYYDQARDSIPTHYSQVERFRECRTKLEEYRRELIPLSGKIPTQEYQTAFKAWRSLFKTFLSSHIKSLEVVRVFQSQVLQQLKNVISSLLQDAFNLVGTPPCNFEIQAMGSVGREEPCPFSDLELLLLYEDSLHLSYFKDLMIIFEIQIKSLGEDSNDLSLAFTAFEEKNPSGFHLDSGGNPNRDPSLFVALNSFNTSPHQTERKRATLDTQIRASNGNPKTHDYTSLRTTTLFTWSSSPNTSASLIERYRSFSATILDATPPEGALPLRQHWALDLLKKRVTNPERDPSKSEYKGCGFIETWLVPPPLPQYHLKEQFLQLLNFVCADLALYFNINRTNTLDIVQALEEKHHLHPRTTALLSNVIAALYVLRVRIHDRAQKQTEEVKTSELSFAEIQQLERCYWLVMRPLFYTLSKVFNEKKSLDEMFNNVDLFEISFQELVSTPNARFVEPWIRHFVSYLIESNSSIQEHTSFYKRLLETPHLTNFYFQTILQSRSSESLIVLGDIPNRTGERASYHTRNQNLLSSLDKLTLFEPPKDSPIQVEIVGVNSFHKYLMPELIHQILDEKGDIKNSYPKSAHRVTGYGGLHFKQKPMHPMMEFAIHNLFYRLGGFLTPASTLVRFKVNMGGSTKVFPVLISATISGETLKALAQSSKSLTPNDIEGKQWTWLVICSVLTRPEDGLLSNYIKNEEGKLFCIDNDISFVEPITQSLFNWRIFNFCSALFCFLHEKPLESEVLKEFCTLDPDLILDAWMEDLINQEKFYSTLFSSSECQEMFKEEDDENRFIAEVLFKEGTLATLYTQFWRIQNYLRSCLRQEKSITSLDLLSQLLSLKDSPMAEKSVGAIVSRKYLEAVNRKSSIEESLEYVISRDSTQSLRSKTSDLACFGKPLTLEEYQKLKLYSASKAREELKVTLLTKPEEDILAGSINGLKTLHASFKKISTNGSPDLARQILIFDSLVTRLSQQPQKYEIVILNHCAIIDSIKLLPFLHPGLHVLDLQYCSPIEEALLEIIARECPNLEELYLKETSLRSIPKKGYITNDPLFFPNLKHFQVQNCKDLLQIRLKVPKLRKLILNDNLNLKNIEILDLEFFPEMNFENCYSLDLQDFFNKLNPLTFLERLIEKQMPANQAILPNRLHHSLFVELGNAISQAIVSEGYEKTYIKYIDPLFQLIERSKHDPTMDRVAANAVTILNFANISFAQKDFKGIRIPGANLGRALLAYTNLENVILDEVCLAEAVLANANLKGAQLNKVDLGPIRLACSAPVTVVCCGPQGQLYIGCTDGSIIWWNFAEGHHAVIEKASGPLEYLIVTENQELLFVEKNRQQIRAKNLNSSQPSDVVYNFEKHTITSLLKNGKCLIFQNENLWNLDIFSQTKESISDQMPYQLDTVTCSPNQEVLAGFIHGKIYIWEIFFHSANAESSLRNLDADSDFECLAWSKIGNHIAAGDKNGIIKIWRVGDGKELQKIQAHSKNIKAIVWIDEKKIASASDDRTIKIWDIITGKIIRSFEGHLSTVKNLLWLNDVNKLVSIEDHTVRVWDIDKHGYLKQLPGHFTQISALAWDIEGGSVVSGSFDRTLRFWDALLFCEVKPSVQLPFPIHDLTWSKERRLAACYPKQKNFACIWNVDKGKEEKELRFRSDNDNFRNVLKLYFLGPQRIFCSTASLPEEPTPNYIYDIPNSIFDNFINSYDFWAWGSFHQRKGYTKKIVFDPALEGKIAAIEAVNSSFFITANQDHIEINHNCQITGFFQLKPDLFLMGDENGRLTCWKVELQNKENPFLILQWTNNLILNCEKLNITGAKGLSKLNRKVLTDYGAFDNFPVEQALKSESIPTVGTGRNTRHLSISCDAYQNQNKDSFGFRKSSLTTSVKLSSSGKDSFFAFQWNASTVASTLWMDSTAQISEDMVLKVNAISSYLKQQHLEMRGIKADGNCFCYAYLGSLDTLIQKVPSIELSKDKIGFLRKTIADQYEQSTLDSKNQYRIVQIKRDREWIMASGEGDLLAQAIGIPIRVITVNLYQGKCGVSDMMTFSDKNKPRQEWNTIRPSEKPLEYITIIDLGGHFVYAQPILQTILD